MSTRLWVTAFDLNQMKKWFGSKDAVIKQKLITEITQQCQSSVSSPETIEEKQLLADSLSRITVVIDDGPPRAEGQEFASDVCAAYALARLSRIKPQPWDNEQEEDEWNWMDLLDLSNQFENRFDPIPKHLCSILLKDDPFSTTKFAANCGWYSYITAAEAEQLSALLSVTYKEACELVDSGALNDVDFESGLLDVIAYILETLKKASGRDLFVYAA